VYLAIACSSIQYTDTPLPPLAAGVGHPGPGHEPRSNALALRVVSPGPWQAGRRHAVTVTPLLLPVHRARGSDARTDGRMPACAPELASRPRPDDDDLVCSRPPRQHLPWPFPRRPRRPCQGAPVTLPPPPVVGWRQALTAGSRRRARTRTGQRPPANLTGRLDVSSSHRSLHRQDVCRGAENPRAPAAETQTAENRPRTACCPATDATGACGLAPHGRRAVPCASGHSVRCSVGVVPCRSALVVVDEGGPARERRGRWARPPTPHGPQGHCCPPRDYCSASACFGQ
jgi:hypothetical protein